MHWYADLVRCNGAETMDEWDQETLEKAVAEKANEYNNNKPTEIVCYQASDGVFSSLYWCYRSASVWDGTVLFSFTSNKRSRGNTSENLERGNMMFVRGR